MTGPPDIHTFSAMRRVLRSVSLGIAVLGGGLWFFGGMNTGPSQWTEDATVAEHAPGVAAERRAVFRPGLPFLGSCLAASFVLWCTSWATRATAKKGTPGAGT